MSFYNYFNNLNFTFPTLNNTGGFSQSFSNFTFPLPDFSFNKSSFFQPIFNNWNLNQNFDSYNFQNLNIGSIATNTGYSSPWMNNTPINFFNPINVDYTDFNSFYSTTPTYKSSSSSGSNSTYKYANLSRSEALKLAKRDSGLEELSSGKGWNIINSSFTNDIPFAKKGTGALLSKISEEIGETLLVTSALGTKSSPHAKGSSDCSHYNEENPKLDFGGGLSQSRAKSLATKLKNTDYFSRVEVEANGDGNYHLDVQIKDSAYNNLNIVA